MYILYASTTGYDVYLQLKDLTLDPNVKKWDVTVLLLDRNRRHLDRATLQRFWEVLDK